MSTAGVLTFGLAAISGFRVASLTTTGVLKPAELTLWVFTYSAFGLSAFLQVDSQRFPLLQHIQGVYNTGVQARAAVVVIVGLAAFSIGGRLRARGAGDSEAALRFLAIDRRRARLVAAGTSALGLSGIVLLGPGLFLTSREEFTGGVSLWLRSPAIGGAFVSAAVLRNHASTRAAFAAANWPFIASILIALYVCNPLTSARQFTAALWTGLFLLLVDTRSRRARTMFGSALVVSALLLYPLMNQFRWASSEDIPPTLSSGLVDSYISSHDYSMFSQLQTGIVYTDRFGLRRGKQLTAATFFFVPRSIWTSKAYDTGDVTHHALGMPDRFNISSPLWMELYVDGSWGLVTVGFLAVGYFARWSDSRYARYRFDRQTTGALLGATTVAFGTIVLRGALLPVAGRLAIPLFLILLASNRKTSSSAHKSSAVRSTALEPAGGARG